MPEQQQRSNPYQAPSPAGPGGLPLRSPSDLPPAGPAHPQVRAYLDASRRRPGEPAPTVALEGYWAIRTAMTAERALEAVFVHPPLAAGGDDRALIATLLRQGVPVLQVSERLLRRLSRRDGPDGMAALARWPTWRLEDVPVGPGALVLVTDRPERAGNLGTMIRTADGAGAAGVLVADPQVRLSNQAVVKASMGSVFTLPTVVTTAEGAQAWLRRHRFQVVAATPDGDCDYREVRYRLPAAIVVGNERQGVSPAWRRAADAACVIPMRGRADSLNVGVAAALLLYEARRPAADPGAEPTLD